MDIESARRLRKSERGQTLLLTAIGMVAVLAMTVLAIDITALYVAKDQAQATADAAALAGASDSQFWHNLCTIHRASEHGLQWRQWASGFMGASCGRPQSDRGRFCDGDYFMFSPDRH
jgi:Putative Flp pilus-assembly TadE/G-like